MDVFSRGGYPTRIPIIPLPSQIEARSGAVLSKRPAATTLGPVERPAHHRYVHLSGHLPGPRLLPDAPQPGLRYEPVTKELDEQAYPRLTAMAETAWTLLDRRYYQDFLYRLEWFF